MLGRDNPGGKAFSYILFLISYVQIFFSSSLSPPYFPRSGKQTKKKKFSDQTLIGGINLMGVAAVAGFTNRLRRVKCLSRQSSQTFYSILRGSIPLVGKTKMKLSIRRVGGISYSRTTRDLQFAVQCTVSTTATDTRP